MFSQRYCNVSVACQKSSVDVEYCPRWLTCDVVKDAFHDKGAGGLARMDPAGHNDKLLVPDVVDGVGAGDGQDGDIIARQRLTQDLLLDVLGSLRVLHDLLHIQHHIRISRKGILMDSDQGENN